MSKKALIFGVTGQDGSYLAELLLEKGYEVHGLVRRSATGNTRNIDHILNEIHIHRGDLADTTSIYRVINEVKPDEIYNEADQDHVSWSYDTVDYSCDITGAAVARILEIIKQIHPRVKFFQPLSSNIFGKAIETPQNEKTAFNPQSPYAAAKVFAYVLCQYYRDVFNIRVSTGIFYNHESERRTEDYVTRKITRGAAKIYLGMQDKLFLGNLDAMVDFGYAPEYMKAAWDIMQLDYADDFIISTGEAHTVKEFLYEAFSLVDLNPNDYVEFDPKYARPSDTSLLVGDTSKAAKAFGFKPDVKFKKLVKLMIENDIKILKQDLTKTDQR